MSQPLSAGLSQHPADRLSRELIRTGRPATPDEVAPIIERLATAPFDRNAKRVRIEDRGSTYLGRTLGAREDALVYHLFKRVVLDAQWAIGTSAEQYLADLRAAVQALGARLAVFSRRGGNLVATVTPTTSVVRPARRGPGSLPLLLIIYSADRGCILTGYEISRLSEARIPGEIRWLK